MLLSRSRAPFRLLLTAAQNGLDSRIHFWFRAGKHDYRRLCDNAQWNRGPRAASLLRRVCGRCWALHLDDRQSGLRAFCLTYKQKGVFALEADELHQTLDGQDNVTMRPVPMMKFAEFCAMDSTCREQIMAKRANDARRRRERRKPGDQSGGGNGYYGPLCKHLGVNHWDTYDIEQLAVSIPNVDLSKRGGEKRLTTYQTLQHSYVATWRAQQGSYFSVPPVNVSFGELSVRVDPEVGMRTPTAGWVLKLWFDDTDLTESVLDVCYYLLSEAAIEAGWERLWRLGIWDVRSAQVREAMPPPRGMQEWVDNAADEYLDLWRRFNI